MRLHTHPAHEGAPEAFLAIGARARQRPGHTCFGEEREALAFAFSRDNPWFRGGQEAALVYGEHARLALFAPRPGVINGAPSCFFGYFEAAEHEDAPAEVAALLAHAREWSRARGATQLYGPINFSTYGDYRLKVAEEPGALPFLGEPHNPPGYAALLEAAGATRRQRYVTQIFDSEHVAAQRERKQTSREALRRRGYRFEALSVQLWMDHLRELHALTDSIFGDNFAYTPLPSALFERMCGERFIARCDPTTSVVALGPDGAIAGVFLTSPHYGALLTGAQAPRASALSYEEHWPALARLEAAHTLVMKTVGVRRELRGEGLMSALTLEVFDRGEDRYARWMGALIREDNPSRRFADGLHPEQREYALYGVDVA